MNVELTKKTFIHLLRGVEPSYDSITKASASTGISRTSISNNLNGKSKSAGGFLWKKV